MSILPTCEKKKNVYENMYKVKVLEAIIIMKHVSGIA